MSRHAARRDRLRKLIRKEGADALLVTNFTNVTYLTGFTGDDSYLLVTGDGEVLLTDFRYVEQVADECPDLAISSRSRSTSLLDAVARRVGKARLGKLAIEANSLSVALHAQLAEKMPRVELVATRGAVEQLRMIKDRDEIERTRRATWQARRGFEVVRAGLTPEMTEKEVAAELEYQLRRFGAKGFAFPPIIAVGPRAALPHAAPTDKRIGESDFVLFDWGANEGLYLSDLTRIVVTGKITPKLERIYKVVLKSQLAAIAAIRPGVTCEQVDRKARAVIARAGHDKHFGHGLGHGVGLVIHEAPRLGQGQKQVLKPGMIITVEPGIYLPGWGGVRIEDDVLVTRSGHEVLSSVPKTLESCVVG